MQFSIENTGIIHNAKISLNGLTVIGGENDTGKSTIGKLLFAIVKGISRFEQDLHVSKEKSLNRLVEELYFSIRRITKVDDEVRKVFSINFMRELKTNLDNYPTLTVENIEFIFREKEQYINTFEISENEKKRLLAKLLLIKQELLIEENKTETVKKALTQAFFSEFYGEISSKFNKKKSILKLDEAGNNIFEIEISKDKIERFDIFDDIFFNEVTFVETPIILQLYNVINSSQTLIEDFANNKMGYGPKVSLHLKDLISKLEAAQYYSNNLFSESYIANNITSISEIVSGAFSFEKESRDFTFYKNTEGKKNAIRPVNTASGIKSFGVIQLLLKAGILNNRSLLILDEPETHLHPKWQVDYARIIVELVKNEIPIIVTSHSPYLIQALRKYSQVYEIEEITNFYLAEKDTETGLSNFSDVTNDLNKLFQKLSEPMQKILWM
jgi:predicted ATPase